MFFSFFFNPNYHWIPLAPGQESSCSTGHTGFVRFHRHLQGRGLMSGLIVNISETRNLLGYLIWAQPGSHTEEKVSPLMTSLTRQCGSILPICLGCAGFTFTFPPKRRAERETHGDMTRRESMKFELNILFCVSQSNTRKEKV